jgi:hypothetical protein
VLLPADLLVRRAYPAATVIAALVARARGLGHRPIAADLGVPAGTVRGWLRRMSGRLDAVRKVFIAAAITVLPGVAAPTGGGGSWRDVLAALGAATAALRTRFGTAGSVGTVTAERVACALSNGRLLAPGWPDGAGAALQHGLSLPRWGFDGHPREDPRLATGVGRLRTRIEVRQR